VADDFSPTLARERSGAGDARDDDAALAAAARRDRRQFARLYERYADRVYRYALARTGNEATADDLTGDVMLAVLEGIGRFDPARGTFAGWLFGIAARQIGERVGQHGRLRRAIDRARPPFPADDALESSVRREDARQVRGLLERLPAADRELMLLRYSAGLNSREIADALGISHGAAHMRLSRILKRLAGDLGKQDDA
jgi:RNA polymerase sigma-70 factor (ECF subfamily)